MSYLKERLRFFKKEAFSGKHGQKTDESRKSEKIYRDRYSFDKVVRSTHGVNCTGSCSWKIFVKQGIITWEIQQTDYPRTREGLPNHEPRGCPRGASYSWYLYSPNRIKTPLIRKRLVSLYREAKKIHHDPVLAFESIQKDDKKRRSYQEVRGKGGFVRASWDEAKEIVAAANIYTIKTYGPDRIASFSPIPAMSMASFAAGSRYTSLIGGACLSFYDWYCDLPPASPMTWGEQTDVPESADWYNASFLMMWGSNVPLTRTPDAHFMTEARYRGTQVVSVTPDYSEASKFADISLHPKQGTDAALGMAMGHVILKEFYLDKKTPYFDDYAKKKTDMPYLIKVVKEGGRLVPKRKLRASDFIDNKGQENNPDWKVLCIDELSGDFVVPNGSIGFRWGQEGQWNIKPVDSVTKKDISPLLSLKDNHDEKVEVSFPCFAGYAHEEMVDANQQSESGEIVSRMIPVKKINAKEGEILVATVFDLLCAQYGIDRGFGDTNLPKDYDDKKPYTPAWQEEVTGVKKDVVIRIARAFALNAEKTKGKSMVIIGAGMNHWYHSDMNYRSVMNLLIFCGCVGQEGGGWAHYVGQEKLRPAAGWAPFAFALDWSRPPRQQNGTSFFYAHTNQWRYEYLKLDELISPLADKASWQGSIIDCNIQSERMGWLPTTPQLQTNPIHLAKDTKDEKELIAKTVKALKEGTLQMSCQDPDNPVNWPRNMIIWRSNLLGSSAKGHEYFLKHLLGTHHGVFSLESDIAKHSKEVKWHEKAPEGKLDLLVTLDFRMSTTCVYSDIVLPSASWYEKDDMSTSDMHPFIHPLSAAVNPVYESKSDFDIFKELAAEVSKLSENHLGIEHDLVLSPLQHDTPAEIAQNEVKEWFKGECEAIPGKTMQSFKLVERNYPKLYEQFTSIGPLLEKLGNGIKGIGWDTKKELEALKKNIGVNAQGNIKIDTAKKACRFILAMAPETNGEVAQKAWASLSKITGKDHTHLVHGREHEKISFEDIVAQPRKIISAPTWSGLESEDVCYNAGYTNVHEDIPWRTLSGKQELYQDHPWMIDFGESLVGYRPPIHTRSLIKMKEEAKNSPHKSIMLSFVTAHQKWGIHSTFSDNMHMLSLSRGGPCVWISEIDAKDIGVEDNDWIEVFNDNGAITARAIVSQRINQGLSIMYHAQEKIVNTPGSNLTGHRAGLHNSVSKICPKPTHMIGGYAQLSYAMNYYGTIGANRDEMVLVRKCGDINWMDD